jgi:enoyl-CoA hydratase/carnithine racemase
VQAEYSLVPLVAGYPLPTISCCQGVWMGMGVGLAVFSTHRIVTETTVFAMPENAIGGLERSPGGQLPERTTLHAWRRASGPPAAAHSLLLRHRHPSPPLPSR